MTLSWKLCFALLLLIGILDTFQFAQCDDFVFQNGRTDWLETPEECENGANYCGGDESKYPHEQIQAIIERAVELKNSSENFERFFMPFKEVDDAAADPSLSSNSVSQNDTYSVPACKSRRELVLPRYPRAKDIDQKWVYLVELANGASQQIEVNVCENIDQKCANEKDQTSGTTVCKQIYKTQKLLAVSQDGELVVDTFSLPSACICYHRKTDLIRIRGLANFNSPSMSDSTEDPNELNEDDLFSFRSPLPFGDVKCLNDSQTTARLATTPKESHQHAVNFNVSRRSSRSVSFDESTVLFGSGETDQANENDVRFGGARGGVIFDEEAQEPRFIFSDGNEPTTPTTPRAAADEQATLRFLPDQGDPCTNTTYGEICEEDEFDGSYPEDLVKSLIKKSNTLKSPVHFNKLFERPCDYEPIVTQFRIGGPEENPVCESTQKYIFPKVAKTVRGQWRYIINIQDLYMQGVSVEICKATDTPCTYGGKDGDFPKDTKCKQVYSRHNMLTISPISKRVAFDTFQIPSACVCHINEDSEIINFQSYDYQ